MKPSGASTKLRHRRRNIHQRGFALLIMLILVTMGSLYAVTSQLESASRKYAHDEVTMRSLALAKAALIGYATTYLDDPAHATKLFGYLPCPDLNGDGSADTTTSCNSNDGVTVIGLLPYKELGLPDLRDSSGNCLWYAVSANYKANSGAGKYPYLNWDTQGQLSIMDAVGNLLVSAEDSTASPAVLPDRWGGAAAVIIAPGDHLASQPSRTVSTATPQPTCGIPDLNSLPTEYQAYLDNASPAFPHTGTITLSQSAGSNNRFAWVTPKEIFDRIVNRADFYNASAATPPGQINKLLDDIRTVFEKEMQADLQGGTTTPPLSQTNTVALTNIRANYSQTYLGDIALSNIANLIAASPGNTDLINAWSNQLRLSLCNDLANGCLSIPSSPTQCRGGLFFAGRGTLSPTNLSASPRSSTDILDLGKLFEDAYAVLSSNATSFTGKTAYSKTDPTGSDVGVCLFPGSFVSSARSADITSFQTGTINTGGTSIASVNTATKILALGNPATGGPANAGAIWFPTALPIYSMLRLYFRFQVVTKGDGFTLALADGATNLAPNDASRTQKMLGPADSASLGYAGIPPAGSSAGIKAPKLGIEFDTLYSPAQNDPPADHMAFLFWGDSADNAIGGSGADDNTHYLGVGGTQISGAASASNVATFTTPSAHGLSAGQAVLVSGITPTTYNGTYSVLAAGLTSTQFAVAVGSDPGAYVSGGMVRATSSSAAPRNPRVATATVNAQIPPALTILASDTFGGTTRSTGYSAGPPSRVSIITSTAHGLSAGDQVVVSGVTPAGYNGVFKVLSSGLTTTRPYRFRYAVAANPGAYVSGGTANEVRGTELSALSWPGASPAQATSPTAHGLTSGWNITTFGMTPSGFGTTANLTKIDNWNFTFPLATNPAGTFSTETPAGMDLVKSSDAYLPYNALPTNTAAVPCNGTCETNTVIHVRLDISRSYDAVNHVAVLNMKAYIGDHFPAADTCGSAEFQDLSQDLVDVCRNVSGVTNRKVTLQQDSVPIGDLAAISNASWNSGTQRVTVTTAAAHGLADNATITVSGANPSAYNGTYLITVTGSNTFTYALASDPGTWASGGAVQPFTTFYLGFTNARGSSSAGEDQYVVISNLLMRSQ